MKKVSFVVDPIYHNNRFFIKQSDVFNTQGFNKYYQLHKAFLENGYHIATNDINQIDGSDLVIYLDMPKKLPNITDSHKSYLLAMESSIIAPRNFDKKNHKYFKKIFTWNDNLIDDLKYIKINYAFKLPKHIHKDISKPKLCCLIISNKRSSLKNELYSERRKLIKWFEQNHLEEFDLYGYGWDNFQFYGPLLFRVLNRIPYLTKIIYSLFSHKYQNYKGQVNDKVEIMQQYKFAIAYENVKNETGYITEKIFDVFIAGSVPVYLGSKNITDYIPANCFIDRRNYNSDAELYQYMKNISDSDYMSYLYNIEQFLNSEQIQQFTTECFAQTIVHHCIGEN